MYLLTRSDSVSHHSTHSYHVISSGTLAAYGVSPNALLFDDMPRVDYEKDFAPQSAQNPTGTSGLGLLATNSAYCMKLGTPLALVLQIT